MDTQAVRDHTARVKLAGYATDPSRWRLPAAELTETERDQSAARWRSATEALDWLHGQLPDTLLAQRRALHAGLYTECWLCADGMVGLFSAEKSAPLARRCYDLGIIAAQRQGERDQEATLHTRTGVSLAAQAAPDQAISWYASAWELHEATDHRLGLASVAECWARALIDMADYQQAMDKVTKARELFEAAGHHRGALIADRRLGLLHGRSGRTEQAVSVLTPLADQFTAIGDEWMAAKTRAELAEVHIASGAGQAALAEIAMADAALTRLGAVWDAARMHELRADARAALSEPAAAREELLAAYRAFTDLGDYDRADRLSQRLVAG